jgi:hypothetical protein
VYFKELKICYNYFSINKKKGFFGVSIQKLNLDFLKLDSSQNSEIFELNKAFFSTQLNLPSDAIIFVDQGKSAYDVEDSVIDFILSKFEKNKIFIKPHPNLSISNPRLLEFQQIPSNIPLDLLLRKQMEIIGICSTVLLDADVKSIYSLIDKVKWKEESVYDYYRDLISKSDKIIFL